MTLILSECASIIFPELVTFFIWPWSFLTCFSLLLIPLRLYGIAYIALFLSPSPIAGHEPAMQRLAYASHGMDILKFANEQNINLCIAYCIVAVGFTCCTFRGRDMSKRIEERFSPLAAGVCQLMFMVSTAGDQQSMSLGLTRTATQYGNSRVLSQFGKIIGDDGLPSLPAASWVVRIIVCLRTYLSSSRDLNVPHTNSMNLVACKQVDKLYRGAGLRRLKQLCQTRRQDSKVGTAYETHAEGMTVPEKKGSVLGQV